MVMRHPEVSANVDQFMLTNVVPLIKSEIGFLRAAVCIVGVYFYKSTMTQILVFIGLRGSCYA